MEYPKDWTYFDFVQQAMTVLGDKNDIIFIGQAVGCGGTFMSNTLNGVSKEKRIEAPVIEETQLQISIGMALKGRCVVSIFPRQNFLILAMSALVNTLDKFQNISGISPHVIIRTAAPPVKPWGGGWQHQTHTTKGFSAFLDNIEVIELMDKHSIIEQYQMAYNLKKPVLMIERADLYNE